MRHRTGHRALGALFLLLLSPLAAMATGQEGELAADFSLMSPDGVTHTLSQHLGQEVVFLFFVGYN